MCVHSCIAEISQAAQEEECYFCIMFNAILTLKFLCVLCTSPHMFQSFCYAYCYNLQKSTSVYHLIFLLYAVHHHHHHYHHHQHQHLQRQHHCVAFCIIYIFSCSNMLLFHKIVRIHKKYVFKFYIAYIHFHEIYVKYYVLLAKAFAQQQTKSNKQTIKKNRIKNMKLLHIFILGVHCLL